MRASGLNRAAGRALALGLGLASALGLWITPASARQGMTQDEIDTAFAKAKAAAPGGPWRLASVNDRTLMLVNVASLRRSGDRVQGLLMTIDRQADADPGMVGIVGLEEADCAAHSVRDLGLTALTLSGRVTGEKTTGFDPNFVSYTDGSLYAIGIDDFCEPERMSDFAGYPDEATAMRLLLRPAALGAH